MAKPKPVQARARARGPDETVFAKWLDGIRAGKTERFSAIGLGVPYTTIRSWMDHHPEMRERLLDAREEHIQHRLDQSDTLPMQVSGDDGGIHPKAAELMLKQNHWRLATLDDERFGPKSKTELTGKGGGPIETKSEVTRYELQVPANPLLLPESQTETPDDGEE